MRQTLAMVLSLQGKDAEAEAVYREDLPPDQAASNVSMLKKMRAPAKGRSA